MIKQIAVFLENRGGRVGECCNALKQAGINLKYMSIADTTDFGIMRTVTDNNDKALEALKNAGFIASIVDLIGIEVKDAPGELELVLTAFAKENIDVNYLFSYSNDNKNAVIAIKVSNVDLALEILNNMKVKLI